MDKSGWWKKLIAGAAVVGSLVGCTSGGVGDGPTSRETLALTPTTLNGCNLTCAAGEGCYAPGALSVFSTSGLVTKWCAGAVLGPDPSRTTNSASYDNGIFTLKSNTAGVTNVDCYVSPMGNYTDAFEYVYTRWNGATGCTGTACTDVEIVAHIHSTDAITDPSAQIGVMLRNASTSSGDPALDDGTAPMANAAYLPLIQEANCTPSAYGELFQGSRLDSTVCAAGFHMETRQLPPELWLRLQRVGDNYLASHSRDWGRTWVPYGGGKFPVPTTGPKAPLVGIYTSQRGGNRTSTAPVTAKLDIVYLGAPRLDTHSSWVGTATAQPSTSFMPAGGYALTLGPSPSTLYKMTVTAEDKQVVSAISPVSGSLLPTYIPLSGAGVERGGLASDTTFIYFGMKDKATPDLSGNPVYRVERRPQNDLSLAQVATYPDATCPAQGTLGKIAGISAKNGSVYVSDATNNVVHVLSWPPTSRCATETSSFAVTRPGPSAVDYNDYVWVIESATDYPPDLGYGDFVPQYTANILAHCKRPSGWQICATITDRSITNPVALSILGTTMKVADNGPNQNIRSCDITTQPVLSCADVTARGGVFTGSAATFGVVGSGRLFGLTGIASNAAGDYVADQAPGFAVHHLSAGVFDAYSVGNDPGAFDPWTGDYYSLTRRFGFNTANTAPGSEWTLKAVTWNPFDARIADIEVRNGITTTVLDTRGTHAVDLRWSKKIAAAPPIIRHLPTGTFMFVQYGFPWPVWNNPQNYPPCVYHGPSPCDPWTTLYHLAIFKFEGEIAKPYGAIEFQPSNPSDAHVEYPQLEIWMDQQQGAAAPDGIRQASEIVSTRTLGPQPVSVSYFDVDARGDVWLGFQTGSVPQFWKLANIGGRWGLSTTSSPPERVVGIPMPPEFTQPVSGGTFEFHHDVAATGSTPGTMYLLGYGPYAPDEPACLSTGNPFYLSAYSGWATPQQIEVAGYPRRLPKPVPDGTDDLMWHLTDPLCGCTPGDWVYNSFSIAGNYVFFGERPGAVHVHRKSDGAEVARVYEGPEVGGDLYASDAPDLVQAIQSSSGQYLVSRQDSSGTARTSVMRWTPSLPYTPFSLAPLAWYFASEQDVEHTGGAITRWADRSGNHHDVTQTNQTGMPTFNPHGWFATKPTVTFDGGDVLTGPAFTGAPMGDDVSFTVLAVLREAAPGAAQGVVAWWHNNNYMHIFAHLVPSGSLFVPALERGDDIGTLQQLLGTTAANLDTNRHVVVWRYENNPIGPLRRMSVGKDGAALWSGALADLRPLGTTSFVLGGSSALPSEMFRGDISEIVIVGRVLSDTEVADFETYARQTWTGLP